MDEIKPCPFCGGKADVRHGNLYMDETYRVECSACLAMTRRYMVNHPQIRSDGSRDENTRYTAREAIEKAVEAWNRRSLL